MFEICRQVGRSRGLSCAMIASRRDDGRRSKRSMLHARLLVWCLLLYVVFDGELAADRPVSLHLKFDQLIDGASLLVRDVAECNNVQVAVRAVDSNIHQAGDEEVPESERSRWRKGACHKMDTEKLEAVIAILVACVLLLLFFFSFVLVSLLFLVCLFIPSGKAIHISYHFVSCVCFSLQVSPWPDLHTH